LIVAVALLIRITKRLNLNMEAHLAGFCQRRDETQAMITTLDGTNIGWFQSFDVLFLAELFVDRAARGQGITAGVDVFVEEARALTLGVVKTNPALRL
jgi:hypothetical protein